MKKLIRTLSLLLTVILLLGSLECLTVLDVFASNTTETTSAEEEQVETIDYTTLAYGNDEDRIAAMTFMYSTKSTENGHDVYYQLWADDYTGEVAMVQCDANGYIINSIFSNPYDVGASSASTSIKEQILSQITVKYTDNDSDKYFYSYSDSVLSDQVKVKNIKGGIRVEYTLGREEARMLVPRMIDADRYIERLYTPIQEQATAFDLKKFDAYYLLKDYNALTSERAKAELLATFPITESFAVRVFDPTATDVEKAKVENYIKTYCPDYTYEEMDADHQKCGYEGEDENPPLFKMALEYTIESDGALTVRLPANGIRFNEASYQLKYIEVLPYMGAGNTYNEGYTFFPDGSGTLFDFADPSLKTKVSITGKVYGTDYAYQTISGTYQQTIRYPVFGIVENTEYTEYYNNDDSSENYEKLIATYTDTYINALTSDAPKIKNTAVTSSIKGATEKKLVKSRGFVAMIEEGDALASISAYTDATENEYATMRMQFTPRPEDTYKLSDSIGVGSTEDWTVVCSRKYVGNYKIRYTLLTDTGKDNNEVQKFNIKNYYPTTWMGMALAYRDYLDKKGVLTRLTDNDVDAEHIPLYIETFGTLETTEKILSIPVDVMTPLTTFDNIKSMYEDLSSEGLTNINFKLTGYANGGMYSEVPYYLDWEKAVGGASGFQDLLDYAATVSKEDGKKIAIFPDFNFSYIEHDGLFDAVSLKQHAGKTIDDRYSKKREYSATQQKYVTWYEMVLSAAYMNNFYEHLVADYLGNYENVTGISVATLGYTLNSDFDEDDPYNREDAKDFTIQAFKYFSDAGLEVMTNGGNAYTWQYTDHILGIALDSSRYIKSSNSVPFIGVVLHGYISFADDPLNMEGDVQYALMKAIENGSSIYFTLSYQNTQKLKNDKKLSQYYSIRYDIWKDDVVEYYNELNNALKDVQTKLIVDHEFLAGTRVPDASEINDDYDALLDSYFNAEYLAEFEQQKLANSQISIARETVRNARNKVQSSISVSTSAASNAEANSNTVADNLESYMIALSAYEYYIKNGYDKLALTKAEKTEYDTLTARNKSKDSTQKLTTDEKVRLAELQAIADKIEAFGLAKNKCAATRTRLIRAVAQVGMYMKTAKENYEAMVDLQTVANEALEVIKNSEFTDDAIRATLITEAETYANQVDLYLNSEYYAVQAKYEEAYLEELASTGSSSYNLEEEYNAIKDYEYRYQLISGYVANLEAATKVSGIAADAIHELKTALKDAAKELTETAADTAAYLEKLAALISSETSGLSDINAEGVDATVKAEVKKLEFKGIAALIADLESEKTTLEAKQNKLTEEVDALNVKVSYLDFENEEEKQEAEFNIKDSNAPSDAHPDGSLAYQLKTVKNQLTTTKALLVTLNNVKLVKDNADDTIKTDLSVVWVIYDYAKTLAKDSAEAAAAGEKLITAAEKSLSAVSDIYVVTAKNNAYSDLAGADLINKVAELNAAYNTALEKQAAFAKVAKKTGEEFDNALKERNDALTAYGQLAGGTVEKRMQNIIQVTDDYLAATAANSAASAENTAKKKVYDSKLSAYNDIKDDRDPEKVFNAYFAYLDAEANFESVQAAGHTDESDIDFIKAKAKAEEAKAAYEEVMGTVEDAANYIAIYNEYSVAKEEYNTAATALEDAKYNKSKATSKYASVCLEAKSKDDYPTISLGDIVETIASMPEIHYSYTSANLKAVTLDAGNKLQLDIDDRIYGTNESASYQSTTSAETIFSKVRGLKKCAEISENAYVTLRDSIVEKSQALDTEAAYKISKTDIDNKVVGSSKKEEEETEEKFDKYLTDDGKIVAVTYGDKNANGGYVAYKFFIINYNNFAVKVEYKGVTYTIPQYGYVAVSTN